METTKPEEGTLPAFWSFSERNPKGIQSFSPGLRGARYPGWANENVINPERVASRRDIGVWFNPFRVDEIGWALTQGSPLRGQPWADGCNPVGIMGHWKMNLSKDLLVARRQ